MPADVIAIDGPAASGKSTMAKRLADELGVPYVSTGAMYRAVAWKAILAGLSANTLNERTVAPVLAKIAMSYEPDASGRLTLKVDGSFPDAELRTPEVSNLVSHVAAMPLVREAMKKLQREMAGAGTIVMEGRDIGTCVFPDAKVKFFLTASPLVRAQRRLAQGGEAPDGATVEAVAREIAARDEMDMKRPVAPLKQADDAMLVDSSSRSIDETLAVMLNEVKRRA